MNNPLFWLALGIAIMGLIATAIWCLDWWGKGRKTRHRCNQCGHEWYGDSDE